ncbi:radial spoke head 10 homolog B-like isoform X3 [Achroia grisella]|uniref:radial spoke head 10 homolog B-like isoform X3 n=1 Tax=Achroia grisella TaxID=688607 RepID=UPI0027D24482|nr:radial spoke head 10 homolog B-like isoform X3 [Achroia grisella]
MFYVDSQRTVTRRDSSLIVYKRNFQSGEERLDFDTMSTARCQSNIRLTSECGASFSMRPKGSVQRELVTMMFESMLDSVVQSWEVIVQQKTEESSPNMEFGKTVSELTFTGKKKKPNAKSSKTKKSRSKLELLDSQVDPMQQSWWSLPDEKAVIRFRNGNVYEGNISMKCMHGEGRFQWSDGTVYLNVRHGFGLREYCAISGYKGEWDKYIRDGKGLMIWPNRDFYRGDWKNGVMSGYGLYIWDAHYNNTMSLPSINAYRGSWEKGQRNGYGILNLGLGLGSHYKGEFKNNKKHGVGKFITNNGLILQEKYLFHDDNIGTMSFDNQEEKTAPQNLKHTQSQEPFKFDICDSTVGLMYHIEQALKNIDKRQEIRANIISEYIENNKTLEMDVAGVARKEDIQCQQSKVYNFDYIIDFEKISLRKSLRCYETDLRNIYYKYATICNTKEINFTPVLIRLYLWQLYFDCNVHEKGLTLAEIDVIFHQNPLWLARSPHNPFEKIYFWQFIHSLILVASKLYAKRQLPGKKPDTILANAFRTFMDNDVLLSAGRRKGRFTNGYGAHIPLNGLYGLYRKLGEPHTIRTFLKAIRHPPHYAHLSQPDIVEAPDEYLPLGRNVYIFGDKMAYITDNKVQYENEEMSEARQLMLFNFGNLSSKTVIKIFARIFPQLCEKDTIMNLDINITFLEFFEAFVICAEESIRVKDEEMLWREKFSLNDTIDVQSSPTEHSAKKK